MFNLLTAGNLPHHQKFMVVQTLRECEWIFASIFLSATAREINPPFPYSFSMWYQNILTPPFLWSHKLYYILRDVHNVVIDIKKMIHTITIYYIWKLKCEIFIFSFIFLLQSVWSCTCLGTNMTHWCKCPEDNLRNNASILGLSLPRVWWRGPGSCSLGFLLHLVGTPQTSVPSLGMK